jgi:2-polyprenyl-3-methyl-5-hydroxy-6-metoxy-1,4-benzoquinol methylase
MTDHVPGTEGYVEQAAMLVPNWQRLSFTDKPKQVFELIPTSPSYVVDIGAGIGVDAAGLAAMGHRVVAVEPVDGLRNPGQALHSSSAIEWVADALPRLEQVTSRAETFDLAMLSAVWMHLDEPERQVGMPIVASLLRPGGRMIMSLRHGPVPEGRRMFEVTADETIALAGREGLRVILRLEAESVQQANRSSGVTWTHLAFDKAG